MSGAAASTYVSQFFSGGVEPSTPHLVLIWAALIGGLLVGGGIVWEAKRSGHLWTFPTGLVVVGVVVEAAATLIIFEFDEGISRSQSAQISSQQSRIIELTNVGAKQQQLVSDQAERIEQLRSDNLGLELIIEELRRANAPRTIDEKSFVEALKDKPRARVQIWVIPYAEDGTQFGMQLSDALNSAGWQTIPPMPMPKLQAPPDMPQEAFDRMNAAIYSVGIAVVGGDATRPGPETDDSPRGALVNALNEQRLGPVHVTLEKGVAGPPSLLRIIIGMKPGSPVPPGPGANLLPRPAKKGAGVDFGPEAARP